MSSLDDKLRKIITGKADSEKERLNNFGTSGRKSGSTVIFGGNKNTGYGYKNRDYSVQKRNAQSIRDIISGKAESKPSQNIQEEKTTQNNSGNVFLETNIDSTVKPAFANAVAKREEKYKGLTTYDDVKNAMISADSADLDYLNKKADEVATSEDYQKEYDTNKSRMEAIRTEKSKIIEASENTSWLEEKQKYSAQAGALDDEYDRLYAENAELEEKIESKKKVEDTKKLKGRYDRLSNNDNFAENSKYNESAFSKDDIARKTINLNPNSAEDIYFYINNKEKLNLDSMRWQGASKGILSTSEGFKFDYISKEERATYNYLYNTQGESAAKDYIDFLSESLNERMTTETNNNSAELAKKHPIGATALSYVSNLGSGQATGEDIYAAVTGNDVDVNSAAHLNAKITNQIRETVSDEYASKWFGSAKTPWNKNQTVGEFLYNIVNAAVDSSIRTAISRGIAGGISTSGIAVSQSTVKTATGYLTSAIMGSQVATQEIISAKSRGVDDENAVLYGVVAGIVEGITERWSIDVIFDNPKRLLSKTVKNDIARSFLAEGSEEVVSNWLDNIADLLINDDKSKIKQAYYQYIEDGYSGSKAFQKVLCDNLGDDITSFLSGGLSGVAMSGSYKVIEKISERRNSSAIGKEAMSSEGFDLDLLIEQGKASSNEKAKKLALSIEKSGKPKAADIGNLIKLTTLSAEQTGAEVSAEGTQSAKNSAEALKEAKKKNPAFGSAHKDGLAATDRSGNKIAVVRIESSSKNYGDSDNTVMLLTDEGKQINADDVVFRMGHFNTLMNAAKNFDTMGARALLQNYEAYAEANSGNADIEKYLNAFSQLYEAGRRGISYDSVKQNINFSKAIDTLGANAACKALFSGENDVSENIMSQANKAQRVVLNESDKVNGRLYIENGTSVDVKANESVLRTLEQLAKKIGRDIILTDNIEYEANGKYENGKIYINSNVDDSFILGIALHEAGHSVRESNPLEWKAISDYVVNYLTKKGKNVEKMVDDVKALYKEKAPSDEAALEEVVCNSLTAIASDPNATAYVVGDKTTLQRIADGLRKIAAKIKELIGSFGNTFDSAKALMKDAAALNELAEMFSAAAENGKRYVQENEAYLDGSEVDFSKDAAGAEQKENSRTESNSEQKNNTHKGAKYSIDYTVDNKPVVIIKEDILKGVDKKDWVSTVKRTISGKFSNGIPIRGRLIKVNRITKNEYTNSKYSKYLRDNDNNIYYDKFTVANNLDEVILASTNYVNEDIKHTRKDTIKEFARGDVLLKIGDKEYSAKVIIAFTSEKQMLLYDIIDFKRENFSLKKKAHQTTNEKKVIRSGMLSNNNISQTNSSVNNNSAENNTNIKNSDDETTPDIRYAIDDRYNDFIDDFDFEAIDDAEKRVEWDRVVSDDPQTAVSMVYKAAAKTAEEGLKLGKDVELSEKAYHTAAQKIMRRYKIDRKVNPLYEDELVSSLKGLVERIQNDDYGDFSELMESFIEECKGGILISGEFDTEMMKQERELIRSFIKDKTLLITDEAESDIRENYGSVANYRKLMFGKTNVALERNHPQGDTYYIDELISFVEDNCMEFIDDTADSIQGFKWIEKLVNNILAPKFVNHYADGFYENVDTAAVEMAFDCTTEIINAQAKQLVNDKKAEKKRIQQAARAQKTANAEMRALEKAKTEDYRHKYQSEREQRIKQVKRMRERLNEEKFADKRSRDRLEKKIGHLEQQLATKNKVIKMEYDTIKEQYDEGRNKTVYRQRLGRMLDRLTKKLDGKAKNNEYIPDDLKEPILNVLRTFTVDPGVTKEGKRIAVPGYFGEFRKLSEIGDRIHELKNEYKKLKPLKVVSQEYAFLDIDSIGYKGYVMEMLEMLEEQVGNKNIYDLSSKDLMAIYNTMSELETALREAVEAIVDGKKVNIKAAAESAILDIAGVKFKKGVDRFENPTLNMAASLPRELRNAFVATHLDPDRYGRFLSGYNEESIVFKILHDLHIGEQEMIKIMQSCYVTVQAVTEKYKDKIKDLQSKDVEAFNFTDIKTGKHVKISQGMLIAIYLTDRQEAGRRHLLGKEKFEHYTVIPDLDAQNSLLHKADAKGSKAHRVRFSESDLDSIKAYVEGNEMLYELAQAVSEVYNVILKSEINEVSMAKYGMRIATVNNYYPLSVYEDGTIVEKDFETVFYDLRLKSRGFTKPREESYAAIVIDDVLKTFQRQVKSVSEYCGLLIPIENFKKVYNSGDGNVTLHTAILEKFGSSAEHYIEKLMGDLQKAPDNIDSNFLDKMQGNFMGAKLLGNPGAAIKQVAAYSTANRYFGTANVAKAATVGYAKVDFEAYAEYTPYLWYRKEGNGTVVGELSREMGFGKKLLEKGNVMDFMDRFVVGSLLYAAELHVEQTTNLKKGTPDFYREVARQFEKCIDETQPNNMITSKPQFLRNKRLKLLSLTAFRSQNMAIGNTMIDSFMEFSARQNEYSLNKNEKTNEARKTAAKKFAATVLGAIESNLLIGVLTTIVNLFIWHKWDDYKDEEGNVTPWTLLKNFGDESLNSLAGTFVMGDTIYQVITAKIENGSIHGLEVMSIENLNNVINDVLKGDFISLVTLLGDCFGLPANNVYRFFRSVKSYGIDAFNGYGEIVVDDSGNWNTEYFNYIILRAKQDGNNAKAEHYESLWKKILVEDKGKSESEANDYIKGKLVTALTTDENIEDAAVAKANGNFTEYEKNINRVVSYGFDSSDVKKAVDKVIDDVITDLKKRGVEDEGDIIEDLKDQGFTDEGARHIINEMSGTKKEDKKSVSVFEESSDGGNLYTYDDLFEALLEGNEENAEYIKQYLLNEGGKKENSIKSAVQSASRVDPLWKEYETAVKGNDSQRVKELKEQLTRIYGSWTSAQNGYKKYQKRQSEEK